MSGYELARHFERTLAHVWPAQHPQIYVELARLHKQGLIVVADEGARRRRTWAVTEAGAAAVQRWLRETVPDRPSRNEATLRTFLLWLLEGEQAVRFFDAELEVHGRLLAEYELFAAEPFGEHEAEFCRRLALEWGLRYERAYLEWAEWAREQVQEEISRSGWSRARSRLATRLRRRRSPAEQVARRRA